MIMEIEKQKEILYKKINCTYSKYNIDEGRDMTYKLILRNNLKKLKTVKDCMDLIVNYERLMKCTYKDTGDYYHERINFVIKFIVEDVKNFKL